MTKLNLDLVRSWKTKSKTYNTYVIDITPERAQEILDKWNRNNRDLNQGQVNAVVRSIAKEGWIEDGGALLFSTDGDITEFQHRLHAIIQSNTTAQVPVIEGVAPDSFTKGAKALTRKPIHEIQRKDKSVLPAEATALGELVKRRKMKPLTLQTAIRYWNEWKAYVRVGLLTITPFFSNTSQFTHNKRVFAAWAALMEFHGQRDLAKTFLDLLEKELLHEEKTVLMTQFLKFFKEYSVYMSNAGRTTFLYELICHTTDRLSKNPTGKIELGITNPSQIRKDRGVYNLFLENSQNLRVA